MSFQLICAILVAACHLAASSKTYTVCELAKKLGREGVPRSQISDFVCLAQAESEYRAGKITQNRDSSINYGIFQISDKTWCEKGKKGKDCQVKCEDLVKDDIQDSIKCAMVIHKKKGFAAWPAWGSNCKDKPRIAVSGC